MALVQTPWGHGETIPLDSITCNHSKYSVVIVHVGDPDIIVGIILHDLQIIYLKSSIQLVTAKADVYTNTPHQSTQYSTPVIVEGDLKVG